MSGLTLKVEVDGFYFILFAPYADTYAADADVLWHDGGLCLNRECAARCYDDGYEKFRRGGIVPEATRRTVEALVFARWGA